MSRFKSKPQQQPDGRNGLPGLSAKGAGFAISFPAIWEYLATDRYEDGSARQTSTLSFFCGAGGLQCALNDRETGLVCFYTGDDLGDILDALEAALADDNADWKKSKGAPRR